MIKYASPLMLAILVGCGPAPATQTQTQSEVEQVADNSEGCSIATSSKLETEHVVSNILNSELVLLRS
jgi:hypothetical protein